MTKLEIAKSIIEKNYNSADCGLFSSRNLVGDIMITIYEDNSLQIDICYDWCYFEVFGLTDEEFEQLYNFYNTLGNRVEEAV